MFKTRYTPRQIALAGLIAALYAVLSYFAAIFGVAFGPVQCRFSEALCVLPFFLPEAVPGLFVGCLAANLLSPYGALDMVFGSLATLLGAVLTRRCRQKWLAPLPPVFCNALMVGGLLAWEQTGGAAETFLPAFFYNAGAVGAGELLTCCLLGGALLALLPRIAPLRPWLTPRANH